MTWRRIFMLMRTEFLNCENRFLGDLLSLALSVEAKPDGVGTTRAGSACAMLL